jgi:hypothetical protein
LAGRHQVVTDASSVDHHVGASRVLRNTCALLSMTLPFSLFGVSGSDE